MVFEHAVDDRIGTRRISSSMSTMRSRTIMPLAKVTVRTSPSMLPSTSTPAKTRWGLPTSRSMAQACSAET
ncbi:MAG: hypothetical protein K8F92_10155 [Hyphomicrobium sp.]|uniref:hypothetical protein n=1 Tax=Hyphomicrobium sp. TaxID=82 RepID=UPI00132843C1|nr:hypothetical protein [Hyphomicrobium sp.]KAB2941231.1 MAG: hypothetical protein F9K20_10485 [Hyphomicrobium sp.]MBZ0210002.1 hypothetical protein [Hyphomicrobium sp.]